MPEIKSSTPKKISNPLTLIGLFCTVAESSVVAVFPFIDKLEASLQAIIVEWFVAFAVFFPLFVALSFFIILWNRHWVLYGPGDYSNEDHFATVAGFSADASASTVEASSGREALQKYWKPDGKSIDLKNQASIEAWLEENQISVSVTLFLLSDDYSHYVDIAANDLGLL